MNEITTQEYEAAKSIVEEYESQLWDQLERIAIGNVGGCLICRNLDGHGCDCFF